MVKAKDNYKGNLSQIKREKLIANLETMKNAFSDNDGMLKTIGEIENELNSKKYGLVWEQHEEKVDRMMKDNIPVFTEDHSKEIKNAADDKYNFLLEGDNLHSLKLLEKTHKGRIDVIYIDPPYNTGKKGDFMYDDSYIDANDTFKHSKWLSFMNERLRIAKKLLSRDGFIFISIDDKEAAALKMLCDEIFGEDNYEKTDYIQVRYESKTLKEDMKYQKEIEQVLVYKGSYLAKPYLKPQPYNYKDFVFSIEEIGNGTETVIGGKKVIIFKQNEYKIVKHDKGWKGGLKEIWATGTILNGNSSGRYFRDYLDGRKEIDGLGALYKVYDIGDDQYDYRYFSGPKRKTATRGKYYQGVPLGKMKENSTKTVPIPNFYDMAGDFGNIRHEGGVAFNNGKKPVKMIKMFLKYFESKDITVLDFFAGSGSTAEAVLDLNREDGGHRHFILCTNNENNICEDKTYPRVKTVITGVRPDGTKYSDGIPANLKYYKTDFVSKQSDDVSDELIGHIAEMIQLEHGISIDNKEYVMILSDDDADELQQHWSEYKDLKGIYKVRDVMLTGEEEGLFASVPQYDIPDYYFKFELKEAGEAW